MREYPSSRVDVRSDTVTQPTSAMRSVMEKAEVGDDVLGDDPTVIELQNRVATLFGKQAGLFVPSGTMSNAVAIRAHTVPGDEIIIDKISHIYRYEGGGYAAMSGVSVALVDGYKGLMTAEQVQNAIRKAEGSQSHYPDGSLVCVENTANLGGGTCYSQEELDAIAAVAHENDCMAHIDGARIFNAVIAQGVDPARMCRDYDSISICFSKGLGAPIGSVLVGTKEMIARAHRWRKMFGGGMRQAGVLAAAALYSLDNNIQRLSEDHDRAKEIALAIADMDKFTIDLDTVQTNMVYVESQMPAAELVSALAGMGIDLFDTGPNKVRIVTHLHITDEDVQRIIAAFAAV